jgi:hypothetical protein
MFKTIAVCAVTAFLLVQGTPAVYAQRYAGSHSSTYFRGRDGGRGHDRDWDRHDRDWDHGDRWSHHGSNHSSWGISFGYGYPSYYNYYYPSYSSYYYPYGYASYPSYYSYGYPYYGGSSYYYYY